MGGPLMPAAAPAFGLLLARSLLVQMDVPAREAYITSVVDPEARAAAGVTTMGYQVGQLAGPTVRGITLVAGALGTLFLAGGIKIPDDLTLWQLFRHVPPRTEEHRYTSEGFRMRAMVRGAAAAERTLGSRPTLYPLISEKAEGWAVRGFGKPGFVETEAVSIFGPGGTPTRSRVWLLSQLDGAPDEDTGVVGGILLTKSS